MSILTVKNLSKNYGYVRALNNVSFEVPKGSVFGILGPNGSGKTTLLGIIMNVLKATSGTYKLFDEEPAERHRKMMGTLLETPNFYHYLSATRNLEISAAIKERGEDDIERVLKMVNLFERRNSAFSTYSLGMKQRLAIGAALLGNPDVLVFDEPTNGLDPSGIAEIRELIRKLNREGITIIIASHLLDEIEKVCTHVAILKKGDLLLNGPVNEVLRSEDQVEVRAADMILLQQILQKMTGIRKISRSEDTLNLTCDPSVSTVEVNEFCIRNGIVLSHLLLRKKSLETKFMELTNKG